MKNNVPIRNLMVADIIDLLTSDSPDHPRFRITVSSGSIETVYRIVINHHRPL